MKKTLLAAFFASAVMALGAQEYVRSVRAFNLPESLFLFSTSYLDTLVQDERSAEDLLSSENWKSGEDITGEEERYQGTVISDAVNLASRLESLSKSTGFPIVISEATVRGLHQ